MRRLAATVAASVAAVGLLVGCGSSEPASDPVVTEPGPELAHANDGNLTVDNGWVAAVRPMPSNNAANPMMTAGYAVLENNGDRPERLVAASSGLASTVEVHRTVSVNGSAGTMRPVDQLTVPAGEVVRLEPGGYHLMLMGLKRAMKSGSTVQIRLAFASGTRISVEFPVLDRTERPGTA